MAAFAVVDNDAERAAAARAIRLSCRQATAPLAEVGEVIAELERLLLQARADDYTDLAQSLDEVVGRMTRWVWPLLDELDDEDGRDE